MKKVGPSKKLSKKQKSLINLNKIRHNNIDNHVIKRFQERFNIKISKEDIRNIVCQIRAKESKYMGSTSENTSIHYISRDNLNFAVVYNNTIKKIYTCFPPDWIYTDEFKKHYTLLYYKDNFWETIK